MSTSLPAAPAAPTYTSSAKEGIYADIDTLPERRAIENAARMGLVYAGGKTYTQKEYDDRKTFEQQKLDAATANGDKDAMGQAQAALGDLNSKVSNFSGSGDIDYARQAAQVASEQNALTQQQQLDLRQRLGVANAEQTRKELEASDPTAFNTREDLTKKLQGDLNKPAQTIAPDAGLLSAAQKFGSLADKAPTNDGRLADLYNRAGQMNTSSGDMGQLGVMGGLENQLATSQGSRPVLDNLRNQASTDTKASDDLSQLQAKAATDQGSSPVLQRLGVQASRSQAPAQLGNIYDQATQLSQNASDPTTQMLNGGVQKALAEYNLGSKLDPDSERNLTNEARAGQVARGNYLGDAAAVAEATTLGQAGQAIKQQRLQNLLNVQNQAFGQNTQLRDTTNQLQQSRLGILSNLENQGFTQDQSLRGEQAGYATTATGERQALRGEQANYTTTANTARAANRSEQAGYQTTAEQEQMQRNSQLAAMASQIFGTGQSMRNEERGAQAQQLGLLGQLAGQNFSQNEQAYNTQLNAQGQAMNAAGSVAAENRAARNETLGRSQQNLANVSAMVLGQPITNQFGSLAGAQNGAVGYQTTNYQGGTGLNQNAGNQAAGFNQGLYGTQANMWNTSANIAQQDNANQMKAITGVAGLAAGGMTGGLSTALGSMV